MSSSQPNNDFVAISIKGSSSSYPPTAKLFCNRCGCSLVLIDAKAEEWFCNQCHVSYYPNKQPVKRPNRFETPKGSDPDSRNKVPLVSFVNDNPPPATTGKLPPSLKALKERTGVNILNFSSTVEDESL